MTLDAAEKLPHPLNSRILNYIKYAYPVFDFSSTKSFTSMSVNVPGFSSSPFFELLEGGLKDEPTKKQAIKGVKAIIVITLKNKDSKEQSWVLDLKNDGTVAAVDKVPKNDVQLLLADEDFVKLAEGTANGQKLFMNGKLKLKGNMMKATAIEGVFKKLDPRPKL